jgi:predicted O-methyltransferase YrrM
MKWYAPNYAEFFQLTNAFEVGKALAMEIGEKIEGGYGGLDTDGGILAQCVKNIGSADYLEMGSLFGASAILAALTKKTYGFGGKVVCIDDLEMFERKEDVIYNNAELFGVRDYIEVKVARTFPYPLDKKRKFGCVYIDAAHDYQNCKQDWMSAREVSDKYVAFHDYDMAHAGVVKAVSEVHWPIVHVASHTAVVEKIN